MTSGKRIAVLIVGDEAAPEFAGLHRWVEANPDWQEVRPAGASETGSCDLVLLLAARPGRFSAAEVQQLGARYPLARVVQIVGPWCYGEGRTGPALAGVERMAWFEWPYGLPRVVSETTRLPATATPQERIVAELTSVDQDAPHGTVGIVAATSADFEMLASACRALGMAAVWLSKDHNVAVRYSALVVVCPGTDGPEFQAAAEVLSSCADVPKVVCLGTPTWEDWLAVQAAGATALLGQPFRLADLAATLTGRLQPVDAEAGVEQD